MHFIFAEVCASNSSEPAERFAETTRNFDIVISVLTYTVKNKNIRIVYIYYVIYLHIYFYFYFAKSFL